jgi:ribosomal protein S13
MQDAISQLQQIKGVGEVLARRLVEAGIDTLQRLATAREEELCAIKGLVPATIPAIQAQARILAAEPAETADDKSLAEMLDDAERLRFGVSNLVIKLREQHPEGEEGKTHRQLRKEITRVLATLERVESSLSTQLRKIGKKLAKADAKLAGLPQDDLEALTKGLRDTRKTIDKIVRP